MPLLPLSLFALGLVVLFPNLGSLPLIDWDENIYAEASRQMVERGDYLNVFINGHPFAEKPPFFFWLQSLSYHLWGVNEFAARFPSALAGFLMVGWLYLVGSRVSGKRLGALWAVMYLTAFLPSILGRAAVIDHTFNFFIAVATFLLYAYDRIMQETDPLKVHPSPWLPLVGASVAMGVAVMTKGPLGGVIPLVAFASYKVFSPNPRVPWGHFFACGAISLTLALSWYLMNWITYGNEFIEGFIRFQLSLFSRPLESHSGPWFYHLGVAVFGLMPWTPFLLGDFRAVWNSSNPHERHLVRLSLGWFLFVLVLFSLVQTKLPHYSASFYIPLSLLTALVANRSMDRGHHLPATVGWGVLIAMVFLAVLAFGLFPDEGQRFLEDTVPDLGLSWDLDWTYAAGGAFGALGVVGGVLLLKQQVARGVAVLAVAMVIWTQALWLLHLPLVVGFMQQPMLDLVDEAHAKNQKVVFFRYVSFAALFYGKQEIEMLHTDKFPGDPSILDKPQSVGLAVITKNNHEASLKQSHPRVQLVKRLGDFVLYEIPADVAPEASEMETPAPSKP